MYLKCLLDGGARAVGTRSALVEADDRQQEKPCVVSDIDDLLEPIAAYFLTRALPILNNFQPT